MKHVSSTEEPRIAPHASISDVTGPLPFATLRDTHAAPLSTHECGRTARERVITPTERLSEFDWVI